MAIPSSSADLSAPVRLAPRPENAARLTMRRVVLAVAAALLVSTGVVVSNENAATVVQSGLHSVRRHLRGADAASSVREYYSSYWAHRGAAATMERQHANPSPHAGAMEAHVQNGRSQRWIDVANMEAKLAVRESPMDRAAAMEAKNNNGRSQRWVPAAGMMEGEGIHVSRTNSRTRRPTA
ncbi:hypothetical protein PINS_up008994 [Pythium insidiosum]|nr:hypothetical protein PINS_up008994 [Pythium insidiosum]